MYPKHTTDAIVLGSREYGDADKSITLYTCEYGLLYARAIGVCKEKSRQRAAVQDFSRARVSLVRGKTGWRLAGAEAYATPRLNLDVRARVAALVRRLVQAEEVNEYLYATIKNTFITLDETEDAQKVHVIELLAVSRVLYALGYISGGAVGAALFTGTAYGMTEVTEAEAQRNHLLRQVNEAIAESQL